MIRIQFSDINWTNIDGEIIPMSYIQELILDSRLTHEFKPPFITEDTWKGQTFPVQITIFDNYRCQFGLKEISTEDLTKLLASKKIWVYDFETAEMIEVDTQSSGQLSIEIIGRQGSVEQCFALTFSSKKTCIYPGIARLNTNCLQITIDSTIYLYYTDKDLMTVVDNAQWSDYDNESGQKYVSKTMQRNHKKMIFYFMEIDAMGLKENVEKAEPSDIIINPSTDNIPAVEMVECELNELTEGLWRCVVNIVDEIPDPIYYS